MPAGNPEKKLMKQSKEIKQKQKGLKKLMLVSL